MREKETNSDVSAGGDLGICPRQEKAFPGAQAPAAASLQPPSFTVRSHRITSCCCTMMSDCQRIAQSMRLIVTAHMARTNAICDSEAGIRIRWTSQDIVLSPLVLGKRPHGTRWIPNHHRTSAHNKEGKRVARYGLDGLPFMLLRICKMRFRPLRRWERIEAKCGQSSTHYGNLFPGVSNIAQKNKAGRTSARLACSYIYSRGKLLRLPSRAGTAGLRLLRICLGNAHVTADGVLAHFVDH